MVAKESFMPLAVFDCLGTKYDRREQLKTSLMTKNNRQCKFDASSYFFLAGDKDQYAASTIIASHVELPSTRKLQICSAMAYC